MLKTKLAIVSAIVFVATSAFAQGSAAPTDKPATPIPAPTYQKPTIPTNPADNPTSTGTQGGDLGVSGSKDIPAAGTGAEVGPGR